jgi:hypothetical protein
MLVSLLEQKETLGLSSQMSVMWVGCYVWPGCIQVKEIFVHRNLIHDCLKELINETDLFRSSVCWYQMSWCSSQHSYFIFRELLIQILLEVTAIITKDVIFFSNCAKQMLGLWFEISISYDWPVLIHYVREIHNHAIVSHSLLTNVSNSNVVSFITRRSLI